MHQTIDYTTDFDKISSTEYVGSSWNHFWAKEGKSSLKSGFISDYSSKDPNEDFVELIAHYVTRTESAWNEILDKAGEEGKAIILQKMEIVKSYMKKVWSIDLDELRYAIMTRADKLDEQDLDKITIE